VLELLAGAALLLASMSAFLALLSSRRSTPLRRPQRDDAPVESASHIAYTVTGASTWLPPAPDSLLLFTLAGCGYCERVLSALAEGRASQPFVVVQEGSLEDAMRRASTLGLPAERFVADPKGAILDAFGVDRVPHVLRIERGAVARTLAADDLISMRAASWLDA
jgi:glutaredoxin